jgi:hypothetical protein
MIEVQDATKVQAQLEALDQAKASGADPDRTIIIVSDNGMVYKLDRDVWQRDEYLLEDEPGAAGIVNQLTVFGSYVAFVKKDLALAIGACCTVVNLRSILRGEGIEPPAPPRAS